MSWSRGTCREGVGLFFLEPRYRQSPAGSANYRHTILSLWFHSRTSAKLLGETPVENHPEKALDLAKRNTHQARAGLVAVSCCSGVAPETLKPMQPLPNGSGGQSGDRSTGFNPDIYLLLL